MQVINNKKQNLKKLDVKSKLFNYSKSCITNTQVDYKMSFFNKINDVLMVNTFHCVINKKLLHKCIQQVHCS